MSQYQQMPMQQPQYGYQPPMYGQVQQPAYTQQNLQAMQQRYQQMQPQFQPVQQMPQQVQQPQANPIAGRFVNDETEIVAGEVPMNGQMMFFPRIDGQFIYGRYWTNDGKLEPVVFQQIPKGAPEGGEPAKSATDMILERLDNIEAMLSKPQGSRQQRNTQKKEQTNADA